jgi:phospholipid transport system substrate-binding protein
MSANPLNAKRALLGVLSLCFVGFFAFTGTTFAAEEGPDEFIKRLSAELFDTVRSDKSLKNGDMQKIRALVDTQVMPHLNFQRMTASAVGPAWRQATDEQKARLQDEFKTLLIRTYAGALNQIKDQSVVVKPLRASAQDTEVLVRTEIQGGPEPIQIDYRVEKQAGQATWRIYNLNVLGVWLVDTYRTQFAQEINAKGLDGLIVTLSERNKSNLAKK